MKKAKKVLLCCIFALAFVVCGVSFVGCGHTHSYTKRVSSKYVKSEATCMQKAVYYKSCSCGKKSSKTFESGDFAAHTYGDWVVEVVATCTTDGTKAHKDCLVCNKHFDNNGNEMANLIIAAAHTYGDWETTTQPTCEDKGEERRDCEDCGHYETREIAANGHTYGNWETTTQPTCEDKGEERRDCEDCGHYETREIAANGHTYGNWVDEVGATCTAEGTKGHKDCSVCNKHFDNDGNEIESLTIGKIAHNYVNGECTECYDLEYSKGLVYTLIGEEYSVTGIGTCTDKDIRIPSVYEGKPVTSIGEYAFSRCSRLTSVTIGNGVISIGKYAFNECSNLRKITIPSSVTSIENYAFFGCTSLQYNEYDNAYYLGNSDNLYEILVEAKTKDITSCTIHEKTKIILEGAFDECVSLISIVIPNNVKSIGDNAFRGCSSLTSITIPDSVTTIGDYAFRGCSRLSKITIGSGITQIGHQAFLGCTSLKSVNYTGTVDKWAQINFGDGGYDTITSNPLYYAKKLYINDELVTVAELKTVTEISQYAFYNCVSLFSVTIPSSVTSIRDNSFYGCTSLIEVVDKTALGMIINCGKTDHGYVKYYAKYVHSGDSMIASVDNCVFLTMGDANYLIAYTGTATELTLPDDYNGKSYKIADKAFYECTVLSKVTIGNNVTSIGESAFAYCSNLTEVTISDSVTSIGESAFDNCSKLTAVYISDIAAWCNITFKGNYYILSNPLYYAHNLYLNNELVTELVIPDGVTSIEGGAFQNCSSLTSITIPDGVTSIGDSAFYGCSNLTSITISDGVTSIGDSAFYGCSNLTSVTIPNSVTSIGRFAFYGCRSLTSVMIGNSVTSIGYNAFGGCSNLTSITISDGVTSIEGGAFEGCPIETAKIPALACGQVKNSKLKTVVITSGESIGNSAFYGCSELTSVTIPNKVTSIGDYAFYGCSSLTSITIPDGVTSIGNYAFYGCSKLTSVTISDSVTSIGKETFYDCSKLTSITIGNGVTSIGESAFSNCTSLTSITIPDSVTIIASDSFSGCTSLQYNEYNNACYLGNSDNQYLWLMKVKSNDITSCSVNENTKFILANAFVDCGCLRKVIISSSVTSIGDGAFNGCGSLEEITIPFVGVGEGDDSSGAQYLFGRIFGTNKYQGGERTMQKYPNGIGYKYCYIPSTLKKVTVTGGNIADNAFYNCASLSEVVISSSATSIGNSAFYGCSSLTSVTIPNGVTSIGGSAFYGCSSLISVTIPNGVTSIGNSAFSSCSSLTSVTIPDSVTSIGIQGEVAFYGCPIETATIPALACGHVAKNTLKTLVITSGESIGGFSGCSELTGVTIHNGVTSIGDSAFSKCYSLTSITIPDSVTSIGGSAFYYCYRLTSITIPDGVTSIGNRAFYGCSKLTSVTIPDSVTSIGKETFYDCSKLTSITIGNGVKSIGAGAFDNCSKLTSVYYKGSESEWKKISISSIGHSNTCLTKAKRYYYSESNPFEGENAVENGNYWHYAADGKTILVWSK